MLEFRLLLSGLSQSMALVLESRRTGSHTNTMVLMKVHWEAKCGLSK